VREATDSKGKRAEEKLFFDLKNEEGNRLFKSGKKSGEKKELGEIEIECKSGNQGLGASIKTCRKVDP